MHEASAARPKRPYLKRLWRLAFLGTVVLQLVVLYAPRAPSTHGVPFIDKLIHAFVFAAVGFTACASGFAWRWVLGVLLLHACLSEILQATVLAHRDGDWHDSLADCCGALLAVLPFAALNRNGRVWRSH